MLQNLADNHIGGLGADSICKSLERNQAITNLDLSGNNLGDTDGECFYNMLEVSHPDLLHAEFMQIAKKLYLVYTCETIEKVNE